MDIANNIQVSWDSGTAYDLFVSLAVLHDPDAVGLRGSWAAGVRSRMPSAEREFLQETSGLILPFGWIHGLAEPKDVPTVLTALAALPPAERIPTLQSPRLERHPDIESLLTDVTGRANWSDDDLRAVTAFLQRDNSRLSPAKVRKMAAVELGLWADLDTAGQRLLSALRAYYEQFFAEEEQRIHHSLATALERAGAQAEELSLPALLEELSQGVRLDKQLDMTQLVLVPSFWATPRIIFAHAGPGKELYLFGARPADMSLIPGDMVPDALYQALKAMADPTRLRILRYLSKEPSTPADLARRLRLRSPTVIHHLDALRLARLVQLTLSHEGKRYAIRAEAVNRTYDLLNDFLGQAESESADGEPAGD